MTLTNCVAPNLGSLMLCIHMASVTSLPPDATLDATLLLCRSKASPMAAEKEIWQKIGEGFVQEYYNQFDNTNRTTLGDLYVSCFSARMTNQPNFITLDTHVEVAVFSTITLYAFHVIEGEQHSTYSDILGATVYRPFFFFNCISTLLFSFWSHSFWGDVSFHSILIFPLLLVS